MAYTQWISNSRTDLYTSNQSYIHNRVIKSEMIENHQSERLKVYTTGN
ncbi:hypothetical protein XNC2_1286 [Xenorhabdus nematophila AN6/1]|nr:hypothetical protein XNC2_1286 [Xenorhabdus nematophila AN6/1]